MTDTVTLELSKDIFTFLGLATTAYFSYKAVEASKENKHIISKVAEKIDGLLEEKSAADEAIGNKKGREELKDESKRIIPKK
jgi:hypothetical protein